MTVQTIAVLVTCFISCAGVLVYVGRSLGTLQSIKEAVDVALRKTDQHDQDITQLKVDMSQVKTKQADCSHCP